jgi:hypothetical protein
MFSSLIIADLSLFLIKGCVLCGKTGFVGFAFVIVKVFLQCWPNFRLEQTSAQSNKAQHSFQHEKW